MPEDQKFQNPSGADADLVNKFQGQADQRQGSTAPDSIDKGINTENDGDMGTGNDVIGADGSVLNDDGSAAGENVADEQDQDVSDNSQAEDDPQANREEQQAT